MTHGKNATTGPASTPRFDNLLTGEHAGPACYVTVPPSVSPLSVVAHNIAISDACESFFKTQTTAIMKSSSPAVPSPLSDASNTMTESPTQRSTGRKSKAAVNGDAVMPKATKKSMRIAASVKGSSGRSKVVTRRGASTIPFEVDPRLTKESPEGDGDGEATRLVCKQIKLTSNAGLVSTSSLGRRVADRVEPQGGGCAVVGPQATLFTTQDVTAPVAVRVVRHVEVRMQARPAADITCSCFVCWWAEDRARLRGESLVVEGLFVARSSSIPHSHAFATYLWHVMGTGARGMLCAAGP